MLQSKGIRLGSQPERLPPPLFYTPKPCTSWRSDVIESIKRWLTMCCGSRTAYKTSDAAVRKLEEGGNRLEEDCQPLIEGGDVSDMEKREVLRLTFPRHAATSFLKTGTSRVMREANCVL